MRQSLLGQVVTSIACSRCAGTGEMIPHPCPDCRGEGRRMEETTFTVEVPAGVEHGSTLRLAERGAAGQRGAPNGSLFVHLAVTPDPRFERQGDHLNTTLTISLAQAALGVETEVESLDGPQRITVAPGTQHGHVERLRGFGVPHLRGRGRGDLFVHVAGRHAHRADARAGRAAAPVRRLPRRGRVGARCRRRRRRVLAAAFRLWLAPVPPTPP